MKKRPDLRLVNPDTGEVEETPENFADALVIIDELRGELAKVGDTIKAQADKLGSQRRANRELRDGQVVAAPKQDRSEEVREVLLYWRPKCMKDAKIIPGSPRWEKTRDRLEDVDIDGELAYTVQDLKDAVDGALRSDYHVQNGYLDAETIFRDSGTVEKHRARLPNAWRPTVLDNGLILDRHVKEQLAGLRPWEADALDRCDCGHVRFEHSKNLADGSMLGWWPCSNCSCTDFDDRFQRADKWIAEQREQRAKGRDITDVAAASLRLQDGEA